MKQNYEIIQWKVPKSPRLKKNVRVKIKGQNIIV
jgi:hypothetical protein